MGRVTRAAGGAALLLLIGFWFVLMPHSPKGRPTEVAKGRVACGDLLLTQTFTASTDPYHVWLYFRKHGTTAWDEYLVDHEAPYWWGGLTSRGSEAVVTFYWKSWGTFQCQGPTFTVGDRFMPVARQNVQDPFLPVVRR